jgi:hypothetical protein
MTRFACVATILLIVASPGRTVAQQLATMGVNPFTGAALAAPPVHNPFTGGQHQPGPNPNPFTGKSGAVAAAMAVPPPPLALNPAPAPLAAAQRNPLTGRSAPVSMGYNPLTGGTYRKGTPRAVEP